MSTTATDILNASYADIGVLGQDENLSAFQGADGLRRLNAMISGWQTQTQTMPFNARQVFDVVANQATYTMGPGGDFDTTRPIGLTGAGLLLMNNPSQPVEIPRGLLTDDGYEAIQIKNLANSLWTNVYFNATYGGGFAAVTLWPVPNTSLNKCVLYRQDLIQGFADLDTEYDFPPGYSEALQYQLDLRLAPPNGVPLAYLIQQGIAGPGGLANETFGAIKRANNTLTDLPMDPAILLTGDRRAGYNINSGTGGGS